MRRRIVIIGLLLLPSAALVRADKTKETMSVEPAKDYQEYLQGTWKLVGWEVNGRDLPFDSPNLLIKGENHAFVGDKEWRGTLKVDGTKEPAAVDVALVNGKIRRGICVIIDQDTHKCCGSDDPTVRPRELTSKGGWIATWKRVR